MKYKFQTDDDKEAKLLVKARDMGFVIWEFAVNTRLKHMPDATAETVVERFHELLQEYSINLDDLS